VVARVACREARRVWPRLADDAPWASQVCLDLARPHANLGVLLAELGKRTEAEAAYSQSLFFFSSRRRHTRLVSDWSSDVCSSDLASNALLLNLGRDVVGQRIRRGALDRRVLEATYAIELRLFEPAEQLRELRLRLAQIGRASCREREAVSVCCAPLK